MCVRVRDPHNKRLEWTGLNFRRSRALFRFVLCYDVDAASRCRWRQPLSRRMLYRSEKSHIINSRYAASGKGVGIPLKPL